MDAFDYMTSYVKTQLKLNDILKEAGAIVVETPTIKTKVVKVIDGVEEWETIEIPVDLDLSLESITKETIIDVLS